MPKSIMRSKRMRMRSKSKRSKSKSKRKTMRRTRRIMRGGDYHAAPTPTPGGAYFAGSPAPFPSGTHYRLSPVGVPSGAFDPPVRAFPVRQSGGGRRKGNKRTSYKRTGSYKRSGSLKRSGSFNRSGSLKRSGSFNRSGSPSPTPIPLVGNKQMHGGGLSSFISTILPDEIVNIGRSVPAAVGHMADKFNGVISSGSSQVYPTQQPNIYQPPSSGAMASRPIDIMGAFNRANASAGSI